MIALIGVACVFGALLFLGLTAFVVICFVDAVRNLNPFSLAFGCIYGLLWCGCVAGGLSLLNQ